MCGLVKLLATFEVSNYCSIPFVSQGGVEGVWEGQLAGIARTNAVLFNSMVDLCDQNDTYKFGFAGVSVRTLRGPTFQVGIERHS